MGDPGTPSAPAPRQQQAERTVHGDAFVFGLVSVLVVSLVAALSHVMSLPRLPWVAGVAIVSLVCIGVARFEGGATPITLWWVLAFLLGGGWLTWERFADVRTPAPWVWLVAVAAGLAVAYPLVRHRFDRLEAEAARRAAERARFAEENRWPRLLEKIGYPGVRVLGREDTESGYVLDLRLPGNGKVTVKRLRTDLEQLEVAADARRGSLHFEDGETARDVLLYVSTRDFLAETVPYEDNGELLSIRNPIPIGRYEDGTVCELTLREIAVLIVGLRGAGKSNLLTVLLAQLVRCVDVLIFCIDMKYRLVTPWVRPYLEDEGNGMAVDWAATDRDESERMLRAFVHGIEARAAAGSTDEDKIEPTPDQPAVFLVIDEIASIFGVGNGPRSGTGEVTNSTLAGLGTDAVRLGRSEAMDLIAASQRGTVTMLGSGDFKSQFPLRIGLRVQNEADARSILPDDQEAARILATLRHEGTGLVQHSDGRNMRVKFFRIAPGQVAEIARRYGPNKPGPEQVLEHALGEDYATRWDRFRAARKAASRGRQPVPAGPARPEAETAYDDEFQALTSNLGDVEEAVAEDELSAARKRMRDFIGRAGERGVTLSMIVRLLDSLHMTVDERTVRRWLDDEIDRGVVERVKRGVYRLVQR